MLRHYSPAHPAGTLLALLDHCSTPFGRRRLCRWLVRPLFRATDIARRQDAVEELMTRLADAAGAARRALAGVSDLERALARLAASAGGEGGGVVRARARAGQLAPCVPGRGWVCLLSLCIQFGMPSHRTTTALRFTVQRCH